MKTETIEVNSLKFAFRNNPDLGFESRLVDVTSKLSMLTTLAIAKSAGDGFTTPVEAWSGIAAVLEECQGLLELDSARKGGAA